jgi:Ohr subfamily peroxiredoxin
MAIDKALYTGRATSTGGRTGSTESDDGALKATLTTPRELGGAGGAGTNPEQLFAAGYSACFIGAPKTALPAEPVIAAAVSIGPMTDKAGAFSVDVAMTISVAGMDRAALEPLVAAAHEVCPYSNATRGNINVALTVA